MFSRKFLAAAAIAAALAGQAEAGTAEADAARKIGEVLRAEFNPASVRVTVADGGRRAWAECIEAEISGIKIKEIRLDAAVNPEELRGAESGEEIMRCIESSKGEIILTERDVNEYFKNGDGAGGFKDLRFDFAPSGYKAKGRFEADLMLIKLNLDLEAEGRLGLRSDGVYLEDTVIYAEGARQSDSITELVTDRVNPLLSFSEIPFPVEFSSIDMDDDKVTMSGEPSPAERGESWSWKK